MVIYYLIMVGHEKNKDNGNYEGHRCLTCYHNAAATGVTNFAAWHPYCSDISVLKNLRPITNWLGQAH